MSAAEQRGCPHCGRTCTVVTLSADTCAFYHEPPHCPEYQEWAASVGIGPAPPRWIDADGVDYGPAEEPS